MPLATDAELHDAPNGDDVSSAPTLVPSTLNCTPTTPTLSAAVAANETVPDTVAPAAGDDTDTVGATVSGATLETVIDTGAEVVTLPAASRATAVTLWVPLVTEDEFHDVANGDDVSSAPTLVPSTLNCTPTTPTLSAAVAANETVPDTVAPAAGDDTDTVGAAVSLVGVADASFDGALELGAASLAITR